MIIISEVVISLKMLKQQKQELCNQHKKFISQRWRVVVPSNIMCMLWARRYVRNHLSRRNSEDSCTYATTFFHNNMHFVYLLYNAAIAAAVFK